MDVLSTPHEDTFIAIELSETDFAVYLLALQSLKYESGACTRPYIVFLRRKHLPLGRSNPSMALRYTCSSGGSGAEINAPVASKSTPYQ